MTPAPLNSILLTPVLLTSRLLLRPFEHDDAPALAALFNDPGVAMGVCSAPLPFTHLHASARILMIRAREMAGKDFVWAVEDMEGNLIGNLGLSELSSGVMRLGYAYARDHWGKGYATEALVAVLEWAGRQPSIGEIRAEVFHDNPASARVLAKSGFKETGYSARFSLARNASEETRTFALSEAA
jgi:[ribosomal protein S5]-alanine N-acetyltransferase